MGDVVLVRVLETLAAGPVADRARVTSDECRPGPWLAESPAATSRLARVLESSVIVFAVTSTCRDSTDPY